MNNKTQQELNAILENSHGLSEDVEKAVSLIIDLGLYFKLNPYDDSEKEDVLEKFDNMRIKTSIIADILNDIAEKALKVEAHSDALLLYTKEGADAE